MTNIKEKIILLIFGDEVNGNQLYLQAGLNPATYTNVRKGVRDLGNLTVDTAVKLESYYNELEALGVIKYNKQTIDKYNKNTN